MALRPTFSGWQPLQAYAIALYPYKANGLHEINLEVGEKFQIEEEIMGWYKGQSMGGAIQIPGSEPTPSQGIKKGIIPAGFVKTFESLSSLENDTEVLVMLMQPYLKGKEAVLNKSVEEQNVIQFVEIRNELVELVSLRQKLISQTGPDLDKTKEALKKILLANSGPTRPGRRGTVTSATTTSRLHQRGTLRMAKKDISEEGVIKTYQKHVDQRSKMAAQVRDQTPASPQTKAGPSPSVSNKQRSTGSISKKEGVQTSSLLKDALTRSGSPSIARRNNSKRALLENADLAGNAKDKSSSMQLYMDMKVFMCSTGEPSELCFSVYNATQKKFITEEYQIVLTAQGMPEDISKIGKLKTIFKDLSETDFSCDMYLFCRLFRLGKIVHDPKTKSKKDYNYRRPFGAALLKLSLDDNPGEEKEHTMEIYSTQNENEMWNLPELIIKKQNLTTMPHARGVVVGITMYDDDLSEILEKNSDKVKDAVIVNRLSFPDVIMPGIERNDFYVTVDSGEFGKADSYEVIVSIKNNLDAENIKDCLTGGRGGSKLTEYRSSLVSKEASPIFKDSMNVQLPTNLYPASHLFFVVRQCSDSSSKDKEVGFGFLQLTTPEGVVLADGDHVIQLYNMKSDSSLPATFYLKDEKSLQKLLKKGEQLRVRTLLSSTKLTTNVSMLQLLQWKNQQKGTIPDILNKFTYVPSIEILKFLKESFDAMFAILENSEGNDLGVYHALTYIIGIMVNTTSINLRPVLDTYITQHFVGLNAHKFLMKSLKFYFDQLDEMQIIMPASPSGSPSASSPLRGSSDGVDMSKKQTLSRINATFKALEYIFKFIIQSRILYQQKLKTQTLTSSTGASNEDKWFKKDLLHVMKAFNTLMRKTEAQFRGSQSNAIKNFGSLIGELGKIFDTVELATIIKDFVASIQYDVSLRLLNMEKLLLIKRLIQSHIFMTKESRDIILGTLWETLELHFKSNDEEERSECITAILLVIHLLESKLKPDCEAVLNSMVQTSLLSSLMKCIPSFKNQSSRLDAITGLLALLNMMTSKHWEIFLNNFQEKDDNWNFILKLFQNFQSFILAPTYPDGWTPMLIFQYTLILKVCGELAAYALNLYEQQSNKEAFFGASEEAATDSVSKQVSKSEVWKQLFKLGFFFVQSKFLAPTTNSANSMAAMSVSTINIREMMINADTRPIELQEQSNHLRVEMCNVLKKMWLALGIQKAKFLQYVVGSIVELQLLPHPQIRAIGSQMYFASMEAEYEETLRTAQSSSNYFPKVETFTIDTIDKISNKMAIGIPKESIEFFLSSLDGNLKATQKADLKTKGAKFLNDVKFFLEMLSNIKTLPEGPEYEDDRIVANIKLMQYLKETNRKEAYVRYIHKLVEQHEKNNNFCEAAETLLLHARLYKWSDEKLGEISGQFPAQTHRERKEKLYLRAIELFDRAKMWERGYDLIKELREEYQFGIYDYEKLAGLLETQSTLIKQILSDQRFFAEYFRVAYYGKGFNPSISNKEFIYRGLELEKRDDFLERMTRLFPQAEVLNYADEPPADIINGNKQYLQITPVKASSVEEIKNLPSKIPDGMPVSLQKYYKQNDINVFVYSKPFRKTQGKTDNEFKDLWIKNTYYMTADTFPTIYKRSQIKSKEVTETSPIENAVRAMREKNKELKEMLIKHDPSSPGETATPPPIQELTMVLKGVIDAAVNGGTEKYKDAFFTAEFAASNKQLVEELKLQLSVQMEILDQGMKIHKKRCGADMANLQQLLEDMLVQMKDKSKY